MKKLVLLAVSTLTVACGPMDAELPAKMASPRDAPVVAVVPGTGAEATKAAPLHPELVPGMKIAAELPPKPQQVDVLEAARAMELGALAALRRRRRGQSLAPRPRRQPERQRARREHVLSYNE